MSARIACVVLAAGASTRLGRPKQLVPHHGSTLVRRAVDAARASSSSEVAVVVGAYANAVAREVAGADVIILPNAGWREGLASSIRTAARWAAMRRHDALLLALCDQPLISAHHLDALMIRSHEGARAVASTYGGLRGVPALFPASWYSRLYMLEGDRGASSLLRADPFVLELAWPDGQIDVDTERDVAELAAQRRPSVPIGPVPSPERSGPPPLPEPHAPPVGPRRPPAEPGPTPPPIQDPPLKLTHTGA